MALVATSPPSSAAPVTLVVSGQPGDPGSYSWSGGKYSHLHSIIEEEDFGDATFVVEPQGREASELDSAVRVYVRTGFGTDTFSEEEEAHVLAWIRDGGVYIALANSPLMRTVEFLPGAPVVHHPPARWGADENEIPCEDVADDTFDCIRAESAPTVAQLATSSTNPTVQRLLTGVSGVRSWHTVTVFDSLPTAAVPVAHFTTTCEPPTEVPTCQGGTAEFPYDNNIDGTLAAVIPFGTTDYGDGAVFIASDLDLFSNTYTYEMQPGNEDLAVNVFRWIGDHFAESQPEPTTTTTPPTTTTTTTTTSTTTTTTTTTSPTTTTAPPVVDPPAPTSTERFVDAVYMSLFGRHADSGGLGSWSAVIDNHTISRGQLAFEMARSSEWRGKVVNDFYEDYLGRRSDVNGRNFWASQLANGMSSSLLAANVLASYEYRERSGLTVAGWVDALYQSVLSRSADPAGAAFWTARVDAGVPQLVVAWEFYNSSESRARRVDSLYRQILNRPAEPAGLNHWATQVTAMDDVALAAHLVGSAEFYVQVMANNLPR